MSAYENIAFQKQFFLISISTLCLSLSFFFFGLGSSADSGGVDSLKDGWGPDRPLLGSRAWRVCGGVCAS